MRKFLLVFPAVFLLTGYSCSKAPSNGGSAGLPDGDSGSPTSPGNPSDGGGVVSGDNSSGNKTGIFGNPRGRAPSTNPSGAGVAKTTGNNNTGTVAGGVSSGGSSGGNSGGNTTPPNNSGGGGSVAVTDPTPPPVNPTVPPADEEVVKTNPTPVNFGGNSGGASSQTSRVYIGIGN